MQQQPFHTHRTETPREITSPAFQSTHRAQMPATAIPHYFSVYAMHLHSILSAGEYGIVHITQDDSVTRTLTENAYYLQNLQ